MQREKKGLARAGAILCIALLAVAPASNAAFIDNFDTYANGHMETTANPPWALSSPDSAANVIVIQDAVSLSGTKAVRLDSGLDRTGGGQNRDVSVILSETADMLTAQISIRRGSFPGAGNIYSLEFNDSAGNNLARWFGGSDSARPRNGGLVLAPTTLADDNWHTLRAEINTLANSTEYFFDDVSQGSLAHSDAVSADTLSQILFRATTRTDIDPEQHVFFDNVSLVPEPATAVALLVTGGLLVSRRRRLA
jgi:hypothetical protein